MKLVLNVPAGFCKLRRLPTPPALKRLIFPVALIAVCVVPPPAVTFNAVEVPVPVAVDVTDKPVALRFVAPPIEVITPPDAFTSLAAPL